MDLKNTITLDLETYPNYILLAFKETETGRAKTFELIGENHALAPEERRALGRIMTRTTYGFNSFNFDLPIILYALKGATAAQCCNMANFIIRERSNHWRTVKHFGLEVPRNLQHFDLFEPSPGSMVSLKLYGARLHAPRLWDLPISPNTVLTGEQMELIKSYCINDLDTTIALFKRLLPEMELRAQMSEQYGINLMSKSDAQIAESVIVSELGLDRVKPPHYGSEETFRYTPPAYLRFDTPQLQALLSTVRNHEFTLDGRGSIALPKELKSLKITIGQTVYQFGVGGLHSTESTQSVKPGPGESLIDQDVTSYYPSIILNQGLYPKQLGKRFLDVYRDIVERRIAAKRRMQEIDVEISKLEKQLTTLDKKNTYHKRGQKVHSYRVKEHPSYNVWSNMKSRCKNPDDASYKNYGGRGITYCERWEHFENFAHDMGCKPDGMSIDRINNDGNYCPENCKWSTSTEQNNNKRLYQTSKTGFAGVRMLKNGRYNARMIDNGVRVKIPGSFSTISDAKRAISEFKLSDKKPGARYDSSTGVRGLSRHSDGGYLVRVTHNKERVYLGYFKSEIEAIERLNEWKKEQK